MLTDDDSGNTEQHCGDGCASGCSQQKESSQFAITAAVTATPTAVGLAIEAASTPVNNVGEPTLGQGRTATAAGPQATGGGATNDGTCGAHNGGTTCADWPKGSCCSMYGYCGNSSVLPHHQGRSKLGLISLELHIAAMGANQGPVWAAGVRVRITIWDRPLAQHPWLLSLDTLR